MVSSHRILHLSDTHATASASDLDLVVVGPFAPSFQLLHARDPQVGEQVYLVDPVTWQPATEEP